MNKFRTMLVPIVLLYLVSCSTSFTNESEMKEVMIASHKSSHLQTKQQITAEFFYRELYVVALGDSLTTGVGDITNNQGYLSYIHTKLSEIPFIDYHVSNHGISGITSNDLLHKLIEKDVVNDIKTADIILITIGGNDLLNVVVNNFPHFSKEVFSESKQAYEKNLEQIFNVIRTNNPKAHIMLVGLYNPFYKWFSSVTELNEIIDDWNLGSENIIETFEKSHYIEIDDIFLNLESELLYSDQFHPNSYGYTLIGERVYEVLQVELFLP